MGRFPCRRRDRLDCEPDRLAFFVPGHLEGVAPPVAVGGDFVSAFADVLGHLRVAFEGYRGAEYRHRDVVGVKMRNSRADPGSGAVLVDRLDGHVPLALDS